MTGQERLEKIILMRESRHTLEEIGLAFHITRERIKQILHAVGRTGRLPILPSLLTEDKFGLICKRWLWKAGYRQCSVCREWKNIKHEFYASRNCKKRCKACHRDYSRQRYHAKREVTKGIGL